MKKLFLTLGAVLVFGIATAQTDTTKTRNKTAKRPQTDMRTPEQKKSDAERNVNSMQRNTVTPTPPASAPGTVNPNSSAMPQVTPPVATPPPGAPKTPGAPTTPGSPVPPVVPKP